MNEVWKRIFKGWIESYEAIQTLVKHHIIDVDEYEDVDFKNKLLDEIIETFRTEVEE